MTVLALPRFARRASAAVVTILIGGLLAGCGGTDIDVRLAAATEAAKATTLGTSMFLATDDGANRTALCATTERHDTAGRSQAWFDARKLTGGCAGDELSYEAIISPGKAFVRDLNATSSPHYVAAEAPEDVTATLNADMTASVVDIAKLSAVIEAADSVESLGTNDSGVTEFEIRASFDAIQPVLGMIGDGGGTDYAGTLHLTFNSLNRLVAMSYSAADGDQSVEFQATWAYSADVPAFQIPAADDVLAPPKSLTSVEELGSFLGLAAAP